MNGRFESRHPLVGLSDELIRLNGRLKSLFGGARRSAGLGDSELTVLTSVVEAEHLPTVSQIGRSIGQPRQLIQRAANALVEAGLIEALDNPDHKRAVLLRATARGIAVKREVDALAHETAELVWTASDNESVREATDALRAIRQKLEAQLRNTENGRV
jgi:DNA-binding MarR family transcriptional regulator